MTENDALLWSDRDKDLRGLLESKGFVVESETSYFDVESLLHGLRVGTVVSPELALNVWNLCTDFYNTFNDEAVPKFCADDDLNGLYDRLFSLCDVARAVDLDMSRLTAEDVNLLCDIVQRGVLMICSHVNGRNEDARSSK
ncbi:hypothetical protein [Lysobacter sp. Root916]|uniref:hypothetical protein n=1 Tax=Lysobacter sp. Root916 TaxID=1736606 RepID=UPI0012F7EF37|nr:hypothetical protein [Lysobacter sp. Root916]